MLTDDKEPKERSIEPQYLWLACLIATTMTGSAADKWGSITPRRLIGSGRVLQRSGQRAAWLRCRCLPKRHYAMRVHFNMAERVSSDKVLE